MVNRMLALTGCFLLGAATIGWASRSESMPPRAPLNRLPIAIDDWAGERAPDFETRVMEVLGVDDYVNRTYSRSDLPAVGLFVGYYENQRTGDTSHSPMNCLPGKGWQPIETSVISMPLESAALGTMKAGNPNSIKVNRYVVQKGLDRQIVLYWYQSHGRVMTSEYWGKFYLAVDAIRMNRTDGAFVRISTPIVGNEENAEQAAERRASEFATSLFPLLGRYLPS